MACNEERRPSLPDNVYDKIAVETINSPSHNNGRKKKKKRVKKPGADDDYEYDYDDTESVFNESMKPPVPPYTPHRTGGNIIQPPPPPPQRIPSGPQSLNRSPPGFQPPQTSPSGMPSAGLIQLPKTIELATPGGPEISKFSKRKKKARTAQIKVFQDAANSCAIEVDDDGNLLSVMMSDDLKNTFLMFGKETYETSPPINLIEGGHIGLTSKKKPFVKETHRPTRWHGQHVEYAPWASVSRMGDNKKYKKVKIRKKKVKGHKAAQELLYAADRADLVVDEYTDTVGKVYVAVPDKSQHRTFLFALPERINVIAEEFSRDIPIRRAVDDKACWYVQDTSSEESEEEQEEKPEMHSMAIDAIDDEMRGGMDSRKVIGLSPHAKKALAKQHPTRLILD